MKFKVGDSIIDKWYGVVYIIHDINQTKDSITLRYAGPTNYHYYTLANEALIYGFDLFPGLECLPPAGQCTPSVPIKCECGVSSTREGGTHSSWCPIRAQKEVK